MKTIQLTKGKFAIVDEDDYQYLSKHKWCYSICGYAQRRLPTSEGNKLIYMHRIIANTPENMMTDHINRDQLDNRRQNLRICSRAGNERNRGKNKNNTSGYKGVSFDKSSGKWRARIGDDGKERWIGRFDSPEEAHEAYDAVARKLYGEFYSNSESK